MVYLVNFANFAHFVAYFFTMQPSNYWGIDEYDAVSAKESLRCSSITVVQCRR